jgi:hypothetical protein
MVVKFICKKHLTPMSDNFLELVGFFDIFTNFLLVFVKTVIKQRISDTNAEKQLP